MIITRSPLRVSLGGGGTDLKSYYSQYEGFVLAGAIDKYVYVTVMTPFQEGIFLKYSEIEKVLNINQVRHPIFRETLRLFDFQGQGIEITSLADIPSGTGLGSSGSFTTALLKALNTHTRRNIHHQELAELASHIEVEVLKEPIGKQDQYISAFGGISEFTFHKDGSVSSHALDLSSETIYDLEDNLLLFFTGISRSASEILRDQNEKSTKNDIEMLEKLHVIKSLGLKSKEALLSGDTNKFGEIMHEHWEFKKSRSSGISNSFINDAYNLGIKSGAVGGKLVGAGGGGFLLFYANDKENLRKTMANLGLQEVRFKFDFEGTKVLLS